MEILESARNVNNVSYYLRRGAPSPVHIRRGVMRGCCESSVQRMRRRGDFQVTSRSMFAIEPEESINSPPIYLYVYIRNVCVCDDIGRRVRRNEARAQYSASIFTSLGKSLPPQRVPDQCHRFFHDPFAFSTTSMSIVSSGLCKPYSKYVRALRVHEYTII